MTYPLVPSLNHFADARGVIQNLFTRGTQSGALITSKAGTRRADHYHRVGNHLCYLISGKLIYRWRPHGSNAEPEALVINPGESFYSPEMTDHSMEFVEDSTFLAFDSAVARTPEGYDADIVKIPPLGVPIVSVAIVLSTVEATP